MGGVPNGPSTTPIGKIFNRARGNSTAAGSQPMASAWKSGLLPLSFLFSFLFSFFTYSHPACLLTRQREGEVEAVEGRHPICIHTSCSMRNAVERVSGGDFVVNLGKGYNGRLGGRGVADGAVGSYARRTNLCGLFVPETMQVSLWCS